MEQFVGSACSFARQRDKRPRLIENVGLLGTIAPKLTCTFIHAVSRLTRCETDSNRTHEFAMTIRIVI